MRVILLRHGIAVDREDPKCPPDPQRPLTAEGRAKTRQTVLGLASLGVRPAAVLTSPYVRARQTADLAAHGFRLSAQQVVESKALLPHAAPARLAEELRARKDKVVLCVGHVPHVDLALAHLLGLEEPLTRLKKGGAAAVDLLPSGTGRLLWVLTPKQLRRLADR